ncbi:MAG: ankyrin repeat domain-containing protein [Kiritimatiellae bacterium]|nr:ankyrin repeat domain-containing protein [Kiritimatiellia bacterium]
MKITARIVFAFMWLLLVFATGCSQGPTVYKTIQESARAGDLADVNRHLKKGADINARDGDGMTPLMWAAYKGKLDVVKCIVTQNADVNAMVYFNGKARSALMLASDNGRLAVVNFLVDHGAKIYEANCFLPLTALLAAYYHADVAKYLVSQRNN